MWVSKFRLEPSILFNEQNDATVKKDSIIRGSLSLYFSQGVGFGLSLVNAIVLARILTPHDYGIIGMATVFINFLVPQGYYFHIFLQLSHHFVYKTLPIR